MATSPGRTRRWTRIEYDRLIDLGIFRPGEHLELLGGQLMVSEAGNSSDDGRWIGRGHLAGLLWFRVGGACPDAERARWRVRAWAGRHRGTGNPVGLRDCSSGSPTAARRGRGILARRW